MSKQEKTYEERLDKELTTFLNEVHDPSVQVQYGATATFDEFLSNKFLIIAAIREGIPYHLFSLIQTKTPFTDKEWADFLGISLRTLQRQKEAATPYFKPLQSEKIVQIAEVTNVGMEVFGDMSKFEQWLNTPNYALGNITPKELLKDSYGKDLVISELTRISHGILV